MSTRYTRSPVASDGLSTADPTHLLTAVVATGGLEIGGAARIVATDGVTFQGGFDSYDVVRRSRAPRVAVVGAGGVTVGGAAILDRRVGDGEDAWLLGLIEFDEIAA